MILDGMQKLCVFLLVSRRINFYIEETDKKYDMLNCPEHYAETDWNRITLH